MTKQQHGEREVHHNLISSLHLSLSLLPVLIHFWNAFCTIFILPVAVHYYHSPIFNICLLLQASQSYVYTVFCNCPEFMPLDWSITPGTRMITVCCLCRYSQSSPFLYQVFIQFPLSYSTPPPWSDEGFESTDDQDFAYVCCIFMCLHCCLLSAKSSLLASFPWGEDLLIFLYSITNADLTRMTLTLE